MSKDLRGSLKMGGGLMLIPSANSVIIPFPLFVIGGVSLPLFGVIICFLISVYRAFDEVTESVCGVSNFIPSISAVTGITPQLYFWRYAIGLHSAPRLLLAATYYRFHNSCNEVSSVASHFKFFSKVALILNLFDVATFVGVAYISNRENFPIHELLFIVFLFVSTIYMIIILLMHRSVIKSGFISPSFEYSYYIKKIFFGLTIFFISLLVIHIYTHRIKCKPNAFSWFSASEYGIAIANMGFHLTAAYDFRDLVLTTAIITPTND